MQITGMKWGAQLLKYVNFPTAEVLGPEASPDEIQALIDKWGGCLVKPIFKGGIGKKGKAGLVGKAFDVRTALKEKERLYFAEHTHGNQTSKSEGVTYEGFVQAEHEVYVSLTDNTIYRAPTLTITHHGGMDIEELPASKIAVVPFDPLTGLKGFVISNALDKMDAPNEIISPLVQNITKLWDLFNSYGMTTLEINPIRIWRDPNGRLVPMACDFKCSFDGDDRNSKRLGLPDNLDNTNLSDYELEVNQLRTYQGQSDVYVINPAGSVTAMTFGGGANALVTELLGDIATISSDFGGNPPYAKMKQISDITYKHWLPQTNVLFIIGGKANNTDIYETFRAMGDGLRNYFNEHGPTPLFVVVGRGGPNLVQGLGYLKDIMDSLGLPYAMFGYDSAMSEVINYAMAVDDWMKKGGRKVIAQKLGINQ
ncbi:MAG: carboxylate--amine ligase [Magnetococcales bacterium]|nr:carboxylate--amine ligase [Magnetococcales bacterium]MBF0439278.1 carboxylate--amine ligase [Magnetococcales bacterium]